MKVIGIVGSRRRNEKIDYEAVDSKLTELYRDGDILCSGGCSKGADNFAEQLAKKLGLSILIHYPKWILHGRSAGFMRNTTIARSSDVLIACVASDRKGGTEDTIKKFLQEKTEENLHLV